MLSLGEELRREREFREISLREISEATKINMRMLEAIENDNYRLLPGGIFNRNFIRAYAAFIGLDPEIAVRKYQVQSSDAPAEPIPEEAIPAIAIKDAREATPGRKWILPVILVMLLIAAGAFFWLYYTKRLPSFFALPASRASSPVRQN